MSLSWLTFAIITPADIKTEYYLCINYKVEEEQTAIILIQKRL